MIVGGGPDRQRLEGLAGSDRRLCRDESTMSACASSIARHERSSNRESRTFGMAPVEALACATPIVAAGQGRRARHRGWMVSMECSTSRSMNTRPWRALSSGSNPYDSGPRRWCRRATEFSVERFHHRFSAELESRLSLRSPP